MIFISSWSTALGMTDFSPQFPSLSVCNWNLLNVCRGGTHLLLAQEHALALGQDLGATLEPNTLTVQWETCCSFQTEDQLIWILIIRTPKYS